MRIELIGKAETIMENSSGAHKYFAWPTVERLKDGRIAAACSGFRIEHICPFGKAVISLSDDEGKSFSPPVPVIDTVLDDRDAGLCAFGESGLIMTSFNNSVAFQRRECAGNAECNEYLDTVSPEAEAEALGSEYIMSFDNGKSWGKIFHSPITSPHGPIELKDGRILWVGRVFKDEDNRISAGNNIQIWQIHENGEMNFIGSIENVYDGEKLLYSCEPYMVELADGTLICHIRMEQEGYFSTYQSESSDGGKSWTKPHALLGKRGGAPAHLLLSKSGVLISVYGYRERPYGIRAMLSADGGKSWQTDEIIYEQDISGDIGYPATVELDDGSFLTVFYAHPVSEEEPAVILAQKWRLKNES